MKTDPYITVLVIHYWRSQNIHMPLKVACCLTYVRELKEKSFLEMQKRKKLLLKKHFPYQRNRSKFCIMYQATQFFQ